MHVPLLLADLLAIRCHQNVQKKASLIDMITVNKRVGIQTLSVIFLLFIPQVRCSFTRTNPTPYRLGNFAFIKENDDRQSLGDRLLDLWGKHQRLFRVCVFILYAKSSVTSILEDSWEMERDPYKVLGRHIRHEGERKVVQRRIQKAKRLRTIVGAGYTPRLVWMYGVMLRGLIHCTPLPKIFEPPIGWGAGSVLAARFTHREWLPCIMLGWFGSDWYWRIVFGVNGPAPNTKFDGVPITIHGVRM